MTRIAPVNLAFNPRTLWFDARNLELDPHDFVVVLTARGLELGHMAGATFEATPEQLSTLKSELKPVKRVATEEDIARGEEMEAKGREALPIFKEMAAEHNADMHPISVEYLLEGEKAVFYFESEERVDFRDLVRELAAEFHVRVDMRQIGVRDEARMVGGYGHCGQQLCCARLGGDFNSVSIRMAKEQDLSLNPQKISGVCGRLMCCLRYEFDTYKEFKSRAPKQNAIIQTPEGPAKVASLDIPREIVILRLPEDNKTVKVPLSDMEPPAEGQRPSAVGEEAWQRATTPAVTEAIAATYLTSQLTGADQLGKAQAVRRNNANVKNATGSTPVPTAHKETRTGRRRRAKSTEEPEITETTHRQRRRRSTKLAADGTQTHTEEAAKVTAQKAAEQEKPARRKETEEGASNSNRRRRRRGSGKGAEGKKDASAESKPATASRPRPGQKSSGLRAEAAASAGAAASAEGEGTSGGSNHRRRRRRGGRGGSNNASKQKGGTDEA